MKKLIQIGTLVCMLLLIAPIDSSAGEALSVLPDSVQRAIPALSDNLLGNQVPLAAQSDTTSKSNQSNVVYHETESAKQSDAPTGNMAASDGIVQATSKSSVGASRNIGVAKSTRNPGLSTHNKPSPAKELSGNRLQIENILLYISAWWLANPLNLQIWYAFSLIGFMVYLFKLKDFRQPLLFLSIIILGFYLGSSLDPISGIFNIIPKTGFTFDVSLIIMAIAVFLSLFLGRFYCGWICPLGAVQELIHPQTKIRMPAAPDSVLKYLKYLILLIFLYLAWRTGDNLWSHYEPLKVLVHFNGSALAVFLLIVTLAVSVLIERPFCRYICPLGAIFALTSRLALFKMRADAGTCMVCGKCTDGDCPMNAIQAVNTITDLPKIDDAECINCLQCQNFCQRAALRVSARRIDRVSSR
jgi:ferredoxin-type protein NapH